MRTPTIRYSCVGMPPLPGSIVMGKGDRVRRAYLVLRTTAIRLVDGEDIAVWRLLVEPRSAARGREEIAAGSVHHDIVWDRRDRKRESRDSMDGGSDGPVP